MMLFYTAIIYKLISTQSTLSNVRVRAINDGKSVSRIRDIMDGIDFPTEADFNRERKNKLKINKIDIDEVEVAFGAPNNDTLITYPNLTFSKGTTNLISGGSGSVRLL